MKSLHHPSISRATSAIIFAAQCLCQLLPFLPSAPSPLRCLLLVSLDSVPDPSSHPSTNRVPMPKPICKTKLFIFPPQIALTLLNLT